MNVIYLTSDPDPGPPGFPSPDYQDCRGFSNVIDPVCGSDLETYDNLCKFKRKAFDDPRKELKIKSPRSCEGNTRLLLNRINVNLFLTSSKFCSFTIFYFYRIVSNDDAM